MNTFMTVRFTTTQFSEASLQDWATLHIVEGLR